MDKRVFEKLSGIAYREAGIYLPPGKEPLVESRISKRIRALGLSGEREYLSFLEGDPTGEELGNFLDVISTNYTKFMREKSHFEFLVKWTEKYVAERGPRMKIWCAAAATGEEPYSIALTLIEAFGTERLDFRILATDISKTALSRAKEGIYHEQAVHPLSKAQRARFFTEERDGYGDTAYRVVPELKERILFRRLNLASPPYPMKGPLDVIFCRNVMIYFQNPTRQAIAGEAERLLSPGGVFIIGHSDTLSGVETGLTSLLPSVFVKDPGPIPAGEEC